MSLNIYYITKLRLLNENGGFVNQTSIRLREENSQRYYGSYKYTTKKSHTGGEFRLTREQLAIQQSSTKQKSETYKRTKTRMFFFFIFLSFFPFTDSLFSIFQCGYPFGIFRLTYINNPLV